jgi:hypothetical protein
VATTDATVTDVERLEQIHTDLNRRNLLPGEHIVDAGYTSAELLVSAQRDFGITLLGPLRIDNSQQAHTGGGFDRTAFTIDWDNQRVTCHARRDQHDLVRMHRTRTRIDRGAFPGHGLSVVPGPSTMYTIYPDR